MAENISVRIVAESDGSSPGAGMVATIVKPKPFSTLIFPLHYMM